MQEAEQLSHGRMVWPWPCGSLDALSARSSCWLGCRSPELRRKRTHAGLNKGEARHALARAVFFCIALASCATAASRHHRYRASGLNLVTAAIALWNTVYLERAG